MHQSFVIKSSSRRYIWLKTGRVTKHSPLEFCHKWKSCDAHDCYISLVTEQSSVSLNISVYLHFVCKCYTIKIAQHWPILKKFLKQCSFEDWMVTNGYDSYLPKNYCSTESTFLNVSCHTDHIFRIEGVKLAINEQNLTIIDHTNNFAPGNPSEHCQIKLFFG